MGDLLWLMPPCDVAGCDARAVAFWQRLGFCSDCAGAFDAQRVAHGLKAMEWNDEPEDES